MTCNTNEIASKYDVNLEDFEAYVLANADIVDYDGNAITFNCESEESFIEEYQSYFGMNEKEEGESILNANPDDLRSSAQGMDSLADELEKFQSMNENLKKSGNFNEILPLINMLNENRLIEHKMLKESIKEDIMDIFKSKKFITESTESEVKQFWDMFNKNAVAKLQNYGIDVTDWDSYMEVEDYLKKGDYLNADRVLSKLFVTVMNTLHSAKGSPKHPKSYSVTRAKLDEMINKIKNK